MVDFPPVKTFLLKIRAAGEVLVVLNDGRKLRGQLLQVADGRVALDGKGIPLPPAPEDGKR